MRIHFTTRETEVSSKIRALWPNSAPPTSNVNVSAMFYVQDNRMGSWLAGYIPYKQEIVRTEAVTLPPLGTTNNWVLAGTSLVVTCLDKGHANWDGRRYHHSGNRVERHQLQWEEVPGSKSQRAAVIAGWKFKIRTSWDIYVGVNGSQPAFQSEETWSRWLSFKCVPCSDG